MFLKFTISLLLTLASTAKATTVDEAAQLLSRYPAGQVPGEPQFLEAIQTISESGGPDDIPVLESMALHETGAIRVAAIEGLGHLAYRQRTLLRRTFAGRPSQGDIERWIAENTHALYRSNGDRLGPIEQTSAAYAALILAPLEIDSIPSDARLNELAEAREDAADARGALRLYAEAARHGDPRAFLRIQDYSVDTERIILGLLCTPDARSRLEPDTTLETLVTMGGTMTVRVMMERSTRGAPLERAIALGALSRMLESGRLSTSNALAAKRSLLAATRSDPEMDVRTLARAAIDELTPR